MTQIQKILFKYQDKKYADFSAKLVPTLPREAFIGVRSPAYKEVIRELKTLPAAELETFLTDLPHKYHEENCLQIALINKIKNYDECLEALEAFLPYVNSWAVSDGLNPPVLKKNRLQLLPKLQEWIRSDKPFTQRVGMLLLMKYFLDDDFKIVAGDYSKACGGIVIPNPNAPTGVAESVEFFENIIQAIYTEDKQSTEWEQLIDINTLAKLYIVHEVIDHLEGFLGSCYLYKDNGETKWKFGPVWDLGNAFNDYHSKDKFIYQDSPFPTSIIKEIALFPRFQQEVRKVWNDFYPYQLESIDDFINSFLNQIALAAECDALRWPNYGNANVYASSEVVFDRLHSKIDWLNIQWNTSSNIIKNNEIRDTNQYLLYDFNGRQIADKKKMYIMRQQLPDGTVQTKKYLK